MIVEQEERINMIEAFYHIMDQWLTLYEEKRTISSILVSNGYFVIAIYGMGTMGMHLIDSLKESEVKVKYLIDSDIALYCNGMETRTLEDDFGMVDAVIYTNPNEKDEIIKKIGEKFSCRVISLIDVIFDNLDI